MSIPLVQEATKDAINTSIIAIKRNIERINMLLGLVDSGSPDLSGLATKQELEDAITQVETDLTPVDEVTSGNMQSVTSNAVYGLQSDVLQWLNGYGNNISYISQQTLAGFNKYFASLANYVNFDYYTSSGVEYRIIGFKHTNYGTGIAFTRGYILGIYISNNAVSKQKVLFNLN
jgi:hypothetical protein